MTEDWNFYFARVNDVLSSIFVNLELYEAAPDEHRPHLLWVWMPMLAARDDGLSSDAESQTLHANEEAIARQLALQNDAVLAGRITGANRREYYFYGRNAVGFADSLRTAFSAFPTYEPEFGDQPDAGWNQYLNVLYPSTRQLEGIKTAQVIAALTNAGDSLANIRPIRHWVYCKSDADRHAIVGELVLKGFRVLSSAPQALGNEYPISIAVERDDPAEQHAVDTTVGHVLDVIEGRDAVYDGWESPVT